MNGICAGGTGSFIDQMASLLPDRRSRPETNTPNITKRSPDRSQMRRICKIRYTALINEGATKEDLSASIFQAVVNQTISGLACGKPIRGHIALSRWSAAFPVRS